MGFVVMNKWQETGGQVSVIKAWTEKNSHCTVNPNWGKGDFINTSTLTLYHWLSYGERHQCFMLIWCLSNMLCYTQFSSNWNNLTNAEKIFVSWVSCNHNCFFEQDLKTKYHHQIKILGQQQQTKQRNKFL